ncbi:MAG TPA: hypothetical protein VLM89_11205 [Phycisphaerae bacterium]|nr:hypothetical protein [Phycisphaerae bacterium]
MPELVSRQGIVCVCTVLVGLSAMHCGKSEKMATSKDPHYLQVYSVSPKQDATHTTTVKDAKGRQWYRQADPIATLGDLRYGASVVARDRDGTWAVEVPLGDAAAQTRLFDWTHSHLGAQLGVVLGGEMVHVFKLTYEMHEELVLTGFAKEADAKAVAESIKSGGPGTGS